MAPATKPLTRLEFQQIYQVGEVLGSGGMGEVRRALQLRLNRQVAIKVLKGEAFRREEILSRFLREAKLLAGLSHPNVLQVFDFGLLEERPFLVTELLAGGSLGDLLKKEGALAPERALEVLLPIGQALAYLHREKVLHRDLKPDNILFDASGSPKLTDFGLSRDLDSSTMQTAQGAIMGSPHYVAPEILKGSVADYRSDVYSFGSTVYRALAGATPYQSGDGGVQALLMRKMTEPPQPIRERVPGTPPGLARLVDRAMAMDPADRYPSAVEMVGPMRVSAAGLESAREDRAPVAPVAGEPKATGMRTGSGTRAVPLPAPPAGQRTGSGAASEPQARLTGWLAVAAGLALVLGSAVIYLLVTPKAIGLVTARSEPSYTRAVLRYTTDRECATAVTIHHGKKVRELRPAGPLTRDHQVEADELPMGSEIEWRPILGEIGGPLQFLRTKSGPISSLKLRRRLEGVEVRASTSLPAVLRLEDDSGWAGVSAPSAEGTEHLLTMSQLDGAKAYRYRLAAEFAGGETVEAGKVELPSVEEWLSKLSRSVDAADVKGLLSRLQLGLDVQKRPKSWASKVLSDALAKMPELAQLEMFEGILGEIAARPESGGTDSRRPLFKMAGKLDQLDHAAVALGLTPRSGIRRLLGPKFWLSRQSRLTEARPQLFEFEAAGKLLIVRLIGQLVNLLDKMETTRPKDSEAIATFTIPPLPRPQRAELGLLMEGLGAGTELEVRTSEASASIFGWDPEPGADPSKRRMLYLGFDPALFGAGKVTIRVRASTLPASFSDLGVRLFRMELRLE